VFIDDWKLKLMDGKTQHNCWLNARAKCRLISLMVFVWMWNWLTKSRSQKVMRMQFWNYWEHAEVWIFTRAVHMEDFVWNRITQFPFYFLYIINVVLSTVAKM